MTNTKGERNEFVTFKNSKDASTSFHTLKNRAKFRDYFSYFNKAEVFSWNPTSQLKGVLHFNNLDYNTGKDHQKALCSHCGGIVPGPLCGIVTALSFFFSFLLLS